MGKETLSTKKRNKLSKPKPKKKAGFWGNMFKGDTSAMSKRRKALEDAMKY